MKATAIVKVAVPTPLRKPFDYLLGENFSPAKVMAGQRVRVPFGKRTVVGFVLALQENSEVAADKLKPVLEFLDDTPALDTTLLSLYLWAAQYYHYPVGQALQTALPPAVRSGKPLEQWSERLWQLTEQGSNTAPETLARAPRQQALLLQLQQQPQNNGLSSSQLASLLEAPVTTQLKALQEKGLVSASRQNLLSPSAVETNGQQPSPTLNEDQIRALTAINNRLEAFHCHLLQGVTGSGKTEVYLHAIDSILAKGRQALVLVPEIGLTPQTIKRFRARFAAPLVVLHSGLSDAQRFNAWLQSRSGVAQIIIGTRSAIFTPLAKPGLIIVDEEHDASYKQQEGFRYSARDLAVYRARQLGIPVILGSATPSLESLQNANAGRYSQLHLSNRAGSASLPTYHFIDLRGESLQEGFSGTLLEAIDQHLAQHQQVLVFINRRGFAPMLQCHDCGWIADCPRCEMSYTLHQRPPRLICHHCDKQEAVTHSCPQCASNQLLAIGQGTERSEQFLARQFPDIPVLRVDRDSTQTKGALADILTQVDSGKPCILIGTQMLAKGHHFPGVTLVAVLEADSGLFSANFRGQEFLGQLLTQVAGRAGRGETPGSVLIQTHHRDHPSLKCLVEDGYAVFAEKLLLERHQQALPPFSFQALLRAEARQAEWPLRFLEAAVATIDSTFTDSVSLLGPLPAPLEKRAGKFRFQLLLQSASRAGIHNCLKTLLPQLEQHELGRRLQWSLDIDPLDFT